MDGIPVTAPGEPSSAAEARRVDRGQRLFVLDSESLEAGLPAVERAAAPDAVEILPVMRVAPRLREASPSVHRRRPHPDAGPGRGGFSPLGRSGTNQREARSGACAKE